MNNLLDKCYERFPEYVKSCIAWLLWVLILTFGVILIRTAFFSATGLYSYINQSEDRRQLDFLKLEVDSLKHGPLIVTNSSRSSEYRLMPLNQASTAILEYQKMLHDEERLDLERKRFQLELESFKIKNSAGRRQLKTKETAIVAAPRNR